MPPYDIDGDTLTQTYSLGNIPIIPDNQPLAVASRGAPHD